MSGSVGQPTVAFFPFSASKTNTNWATRTNASGELGMGRLITDSTAQNNAVSWDIYLDAVTWKVAPVYGKDTDQGIYNITGVSGTQTVDAYAAAPASNNYSEVTGIAPTAGVKTVLLTMATKNASASAYGAKLNSLAWIATAGTYSTPNGSDTPGYTWEWIPWMGSKANTNWAAPATQSSTGLGGGRLDTSTTAQNNLIATDAWIDAGTYTMTVIYQQNTNRGIFNITGVNGTQTVDSYGVSTENVVGSVSGIAATAGVKTVTNTMATKNASSSAYGGGFNSMKWIRTGA